MNTKLEDIGTKKVKSKKNKENIIFAVIIIFLILGTIFGLVYVARFIGYVASHAGQAGYVYEMVLSWQESAYLWSGVYGAAVMAAGYNNTISYPLSGSGMLEANLVFECLEKGIQHEVYASQVPSGAIDWNTIGAASPSDVDAYLGINGTDMMSAENTFTQLVTYEVGDRNITVPATYTLRVNESPGQTYDLGILMDSNNNLVFVAHLVNFTTGFNGRIYNYQMILPVRLNTTPLYYFYTDPSDHCYVGGAENPEHGLVIGNVTSNTGIRLADVIVVVGGFSNVTNFNGEYSIESFPGPQYVFAVKTGYQVYYSNLTVAANQTTVHNIVMQPTIIQNPPNQGRDIGPGQGPGEVKKTPTYEQPKRIEGIDYIISISKIERKLLVGNFLQEVVSFYSYKTTTANLNFKIEGDVAQLIKLDKYNMLLSPNSNDQLTLTVFGQGDPGIYTGNLTISGDMNEKIPIEIELLPKDKLPVQALLISIDTYDKTVYPGSKLRFKTNLQNLLTDQSYPVTLFYTLQDENGNNTIWTDSTNVYLQTSFSLLKNMKIPSNVKPGDYILRVTANYLGLSTGASTSIVISVPFYEYVIYGLHVWQWLIFLVAFILLIATIISLRIRAESKKRYHLKVEYSELPKPGPRSAFVGRIAETDHKTYFDLEQFKIHTIVAGATGGGKTIAAQDIVEEALLHNVAVIVFDPTAQWSGFLRRCTDKTMLRLYPEFGMNVKEARSFNGNMRQITNALEIIDIKKYIKPGEIQIFATNKLDPKDIDIFISNTVREVFHANFPENTELKLLLVYDEVHRLLPKFGGSGEGFIQLERGCREFRKWGIGVLMISQVLADFVGQIKANINTEVQMRTRDEGDLDRIKMKYGEELLKSLVKATVGSGMVENPAYNRGKPYFVNFRPILHGLQRLPDEDLEKYNKYNEEIDDLQYQVEQLEENKIDVFDLKLELKLALDKLKSGNFNMVDIYLEGLVPRIRKYWDKLGLQPKKRQIKLIEVSKLKEELEKAKEARKQFEEEQKKELAKKEIIQKKEEKKPLKYEIIVSFDRAMNFVNGVSVVSLQELIDVLPNLTEAVLRQHVTKDKNDIATWVKDVFKDESLAEKLKNATTKTEFINIMNEDKLKNNKPYDLVVAKPEVKEEAEEEVKAEVNEAEKEESKPTEIKKLSWPEIKTRVEKTENLEEKLNLLHQGETDNPNDVNIKFSLAVLYHRNNELDKAEKEYREILKLKPSESKVLLYLAGVLKSMKKYDESKEYFRKYLEVNPTDSKARTILDGLEKGLA